MKTICLTIAVLFFCNITFCQDSVRTVNDKPGTPSSLRTPYTPPLNHRHTVNSNRLPNQAINHNGTESNQVSPANHAQTVPVNSGTGKVRLQNKPVIRPIPPVTNSSGSTPAYIKPSKVTSPIRK
jgi:hypothetical protein